MSRISSRVLYGVLFAGGLTLLGATAANAAETNGEDSILGGTQAVPAVTAPVEVDGLALSLFGDSSTTSSDSAAPVATQESSPTTSGSDGIAGGSQVAPVVTAPVDISSVAVSVFGESSTAGNSSTDGASAAGGSAPTTDGEDSTAGGSQVAPVITAPVDLGGVAVSLFGDSSTAGGSSSDAVAGGNADGSGNGAPSTTGDDSVAGGTQIVGGITAPVTVGGIALAPFGDATTAAGGPAAPADGTPSESGSSDGPSTDGENAIAGGSQVAPVITAPVNLGAIAVSLTGDSETVGGGQNGATVGETNDEGPAQTTGEDSTLGGTQIAPIVTLPISLGDIAISVTGDSETGDPGVTVPGGTDPETEGPVTGVEPIVPVIPATNERGALGTSLAGFRVQAIDGSHLASTGADVSGLLAASGMVLLLGAALLLSKRVAKNHRG